MKKNVSISMLIALSATIANASQADDAGFVYIATTAEGMRTLHELKYEFAMQGDYVVTGAKNREDVFNGTPYKISLAAFISDSTAIMIHAETVADRSGTSDYSNLPSVDWPDSSFRSSGYDCMEVPPEAIEGEHDLEWLVANNFQPSGTVLLAQYFTSSDDNNAEIVVSIIHHVESCDNEARNLASLNMIKEQATIAAIN